MLITLFRQESKRVMFIMAIVMGFPIVDTLLVMTNRMLHGKSPFKPDKTHLHDRLLSLGFKHSTVYTLYMLPCSHAVCLQLLCKVWWTIINLRLVLSMHYAYLDQ